MPTLDQTALAHRIIQTLFTYRRSLEDAHEPRHFCEQCNHPHLDRILEAIVAAEPILFVLPAFPAKSPNLQKVLGTLPDFGETEALNFLTQLCLQIKKIYPPGAHIKICSDGRVFNDLVRVSDAEVSAYRAEIEILCKKLAPQTLSLFALEDWTSEPSFDQQRNLLIEKFGMPLPALKESIKQHFREQIMLNGIEKFLLEDFVYLYPEKSKNSLRKICHSLAYQVVQRSHAWSALIESIYPKAVRLSIHPQPCHYQKLGIYLVPARDNWLTPWHGVAVKIDGRVVLMKRWQAEKLGYQLVPENSRPSYFNGESRDYARNQNK